jgi:UDP-glucose 4-epimerase
LRAGAEVIALCVGKPWRLADVHDKGLELVAAPDWYESWFIDELRDRLNEVDALLHLGYRPPPAGINSAGKVDHERRINISATAALADVACNVPMVFASSADVYGAWQESLVTEDTNPTPSTPYASAKLEAEAALGDRSTVLRISTVYGPGELVPRAIPSFLKASLGGATAVLHGEGRDIKDYVPLAAVADAFIKAAQSAPEGKRVFNISSGKGRSTEAVLNAAIAIAGKPPTIEHVPSPRDPSRLVVSPEKARLAIGFDPDADFDKGLREEAGWLDANRARWARSSLLV